MGPGATMIELIAAGVLGAAGHLKTRDFVRRRLRYTDVVDKPGLGLFTGAAAAVVAVPVLAALPLIGGGAAMAIGIGLGAGVGTGVSRGSREARRGWLPEE